MNLEVTISCDFITTCQCERVERRTAFSVTELAVTLGIAAILLSLSTVAILAAREGARRVQCQNQLHQYGVAIQQFEGVVKELPGGQRSLPISDVRPNKRAIGPHLAVLDYLDDSAGSVQKGSSRRSRRIMGPEVFRRLGTCPSTPDAQGVGYRFCSGTRPNPFAEESRFRDKPGMGAFPLGQNLRMRDIYDGASQTLAMSERSSAAFPRFGDRIYHLAAGKEFDPEPATFRSVSERLTSNFASVPYTKDVGTVIIGRGSLEHTHFNTVLGPNAKFVDFRHREILDLAASSARSYHADSSMVLFLDGRVQAVGSSIDLRVWREWAVTNDATAGSVSE